MDLAQCRRCWKHNRRGADYCAMCGCRLHPHHRNTETPPAPARRTIVPWILLFTLVAATTVPQTPQPRGLIYTDASKPAIGLVFDLPPDYPAGYFRSYPAYHD